MTMKRRIIEWGFEDEVVGSNYWDQGDREKKDLDQRFN